MENQILTDPMISPDKNVLEKALGKNYKLYEEFETKINEIKLNFEWNYYNDGKQWLCKILSKKKNIAWLSIWNTGIRLTFYFTEKTIDGIYELDIENAIKIKAQEMKPVGKLRPVSFLIKNKKVMNSGLKMLEYKMNLK